MTTTQYLLGFDIGSSSVKASLVNASTGQVVADAHFPESEAPIHSPHAGWAEQQPEDWWQYGKSALAAALKKANISGHDIVAIGISYQMHGLVAIDEQKNVVRPSIIWCDSRAVGVGEEALKHLGTERCLSHLLNAPGNFTASKLAWVRQNEPDLFARISRFMLPGDWFAMRLSGEVQTTISGLSEGMLWDFKNNAPAQFLLDEYGISRSMLADIVPTFGVQCRVNKEAAAELGLKEGTPICYRAGDQPNNALSLNVFQPGQIASTAGTSGVVYGVLGDVNYDPKSRVNTFAHVNHTTDLTRLGVLLCINGTGILNAWMHRNVAADLSYPEMNELAAQAPIGCDGLSILPFGNGAERVLENQSVGSSIHGLQFNVHTRAHVLRAAQEGIVFSFRYGLEVMEAMGMHIHDIHAGNANMFLSPIFRNTLASVTGATIRLLDTDGAAGAAKGAGVGLGLYASTDEAFATLKEIAVIHPDEAHLSAYQEAYQCWKARLSKQS